MTLKWSFRYFVPDDLRIGVRHVYESAYPETQAKFVSRLRTLALLDMTEWREPLVKPLTGQDGLSEIRFKARGVQQRPLGFVSGRLEYTLLIWVTEKGGRFVPPAACDIARQKMAKAKADRRSTNDLWIALE